MIEIRGQGGSGVVIDISPFWIFLSSGLFVFLLALELVDRVLVRDELDVARQLQRELLPAEAPEVPGYAFALSYRTANEVGGDYYGITPLPDGRVAIAVGDASGHGMAAGLLMAIANSALGLALELDPTPDRVAVLLNRVLCRTGDRRSFMSLFFALLSPASGELRYACAGHPFPLLRRADGEIVELGRGGYPLGIRDELDLETRAGELGPGDVLLLFSDGLPEAVNAAGTAFGFDRVAQLLAPGGAPQAIHDRIVAALERHLDGARPQDDVSVVVVARDPVFGPAGA
jgi:sigma-B regulation protein RsbU (phosphoserine phosphatase)